jgi:DNA polymerase-3 subunit alpha
MKAIRDEVQMSGFVNLNTHTEYDRIKGGASIEELVARLKHINQDTIAITDPGHMISVVAAWQELTAAGIKPILGLEAYWCSDLNIKTPDELGYLAYPITLLAKNNNGLKNLITLTTGSWIVGLVPDEKAPVARCDFNFLTELSEDVICLTGNHYGFLSQALIQGRLAVARSWLKTMHDVFGSDLYVQVPIPQSPKDLRLVESLIGLAAEEQIPCVAANAVYYAAPNDRFVHEQKMATTLNKSLNFKTTDGLEAERQIGSSMTRLAFQHQAHLMSELEIDQLLVANDLPYELISNTKTIAASIDSSSYFSDRYNRYPKFQNCYENYTAYETLVSLAQWSLYEKFNNQMPPPEYRERLDYELKIIKRMGYSDYMLIVWEYLKGIRDAGIIVGPGRGSAAGSLVAYALDITRLDPIKYGLIFERWLNVGRSATPLIF